MKGAARVAVWAFGTLVHHPSVAHMSAFGVLEELRNRPIGDQAPARAARKGFRQRIAITRDNELYGEQVIEARDAGLAGENFYASDRNPPYWHRVDGATDKLWLR